MGTEASGGKRLREIVAVLTRHGLGSIVAAIGAEDHATTRWIGHRLGSRMHTPPEHLRLALEDLGTTFLKLGQILSTRGDLLPPEYQSELARLQDAAPPEPFEAIREVVAAELGRPVEAAFRSFDPQPLASASIGQAHAAVTAAGESVVVKVRRPAVVEEVERDLVILERLARRANRLWEHGAKYDIVGLAREFDHTLRAELDYVKEAGNAERFAAVFAGDPMVHIPRVFRDLSTHRVLTLERIHGMKVTDTEGLRAAAIDRPDLARRAATLELRMVFEEGFFHADPHPGNFFIEPGGRIGLIDFGMVGTVDPETKRRLVRVIAALVVKDGDGLVDAFLDLGIAGAVVDRVALRTDLLGLAQTYLDLPLGDVSLSSMLRDLLSVVRHHRLHLPANLALLVKTIAMSEGVGAQLDPDFRMTYVLLPFVQRLMSGDGGGGAHPS
jgi:ubiquinone biosynthesis protein